MIIRGYDSSDCRETAALFYQTVHTVNAKDYTEAQCSAWAPGTMDLAQWDLSLRVHDALVAVQDHRIVGFGDISREGYLDRLYVHKDYQRRGIATALCNALEARVHGPIVTHASITARSFFQRRGYRVVKAQLVERRGALLRNYVMEKRRSY